MIADANFRERCGSKNGVSKVSNLFSKCNVVISLTTCYARQVNLIFIHGLLRLGD